MVQATAAQVCRRISKVVVDESKTILRSGKAACYPAITGQLALLYSSARVASFFFTASPVYMPSSPTLMVMLTYIGCDNETSLNTGLEHSGRQSIEYRQSMSLLSSCSSLLSYSMSTKLLSNLISSSSPCWTACCIREYFLMLMWEDVGYVSVILATILYGIYGSVPPGFGLTSVIIMFHLCWISIN